MMNAVHNQEHDMTIFLLNKDEMKAQGTFDEVAQSNKVSKLTANAEQVY